jgi:hypothetical protein
MVKDGKVLRKQWMAGAASVPFNSCALRSPPCQLHGTFDREAAVFGLGSRRLTCIDL